MSGVAAAIGGAAVVGGVVSAAGSKSAADSQRDASNNAIAAQQGAQNTVTQNEAPYVSAGNQALSALSGFYGLPGSSPSGSGAPSTPDYSSILQNLPGYQFQQQQGNQAVQQDLAAQGLLQSGAAGKALQNYGQGLAQNYASQYTAGLGNIAQMGQAGAAGVGTAALTTANGVSNANAYAGNAQATGYNTAAGAVNSGLSGLVSSYGASQYNPYAYATNANNYGAEFTPAAGNAGYLEGP